MQELRSDLESELTAAQLAEEKMRAIESSGGLMTIKLAEEKMEHERRIVDRSSANRGRMARAVKRRRAQSRDRKRANGRALR